MTKTILGLDLGTTSIGWALVKEGADADIIKAGVRVIPLTTEEIQNFDKGRSITTNADRTTKRSARRNLQRYKLRRQHLISLLIKQGLISEETVLAETGNKSTFETYRLRSLAVTEQIELVEFARILLMLNKKRGYKSSRKTKGEDEGSAVDGMEIAKFLYYEGLTPGQLVNQRYQEGKKSIPDFYRSDLQNEFDRIWNFQKVSHTELLCDENYEILKGKSKTITSSFFRKLGFDGVELKGNLNEKKKQRYAIRAKAVNEQCTINELAEIFPEINGAIHSSSGYLGEISDRSKELFFNNETVGQYQYKLIQENSHHRLKGQVFYRQDYLDEFNTIWEKQREFYPTELNEALKTVIRDIVIFYQRPLKSQKGLLSTCELESKKCEIEIEGKIKTKLIGPKVCPKSSPLFQEYKIWALLNNIEILFGNDRKGFRLDQEQMQLLFNELNWKEKLTANEVLKLLGYSKEYKLNFDSIDGNKTNAAIIQVLEKLFEKEGYEELGLTRLGSEKLFGVIYPLMDTLGVNKEILNFDSDLEGKEFEKQTSFQFWHLLYSFEGDTSRSGIDKLRSALFNKFGFPYETNSVICNINLPGDYSGLSSKAIKNILPHLKDGNTYDKACLLAGYNHSHSETKADLDNKILKDQLTILPKNSLRNPVVEKILNQMINVVNEIVNKYGKPDEIRVEMARDLKKSAEERKKATDAIRVVTVEHDKLKRELLSEFDLPSVSRNDLIRYKLFLELKDNGYKTLYSNQPIERAKLFSAEYDIEHIIPQTKLFDDSFSNKTLELRSVNLKKGNATAADFVLTEYGEEALAEYHERIHAVFGNQPGKKTKIRKLLMCDKDIPSNFIERDLRDTQYIAKKAKEILSELVRNVHTTTGSITERLREDWQLVDVLKELNLNKYQLLEQTEEVRNRHGQRVIKIKDWSKRNDHRHHAMDAITVAFTKPSFVQYLNNLNAKSDKSGSIYAIEQKETYRDEKNKRRFIAPIMPLSAFRSLTKEHLESILVSFKAKNKVSTKNKNITKTKAGKRTAIEETPRGQLHNDTIYGSSKHYTTKYEKIGASFDEIKISKVANKQFRNLLLNRLKKFDSDPKMAFTGKNSLIKNPIYLDELESQTLPESVKLVELETRYTSRKTISPELSVEKVIDKGIQRILKKRLREFGGDPKKAFINLDDNPIYLNREKGIILKTVTVTAVSNAIALRNKKDHLGHEVLDSSNNPVPVDFVNTANNHHIAVYQNEKGNLCEEVVSFFEAVTRKNQNMPIIKEVNEDGCKLLFTLKQNEYFIFPNETTGFNPKEIDLFDSGNFKRISPNLYRVQKIASKDYVFRHHLETMLNDHNKLKGVIYKRLQSLAPLNSVVKVRLNHLGEIVHVGE